MPGQTQSPPGPVIPRRTLLGLAASLLPASVCTGTTPSKAGLPPDPPLTRLAAPWATPPLLPAIREEDALLAIAHVGPVSDGGWSTIHNEAVASVRTAFPRLRTVWVESVPYSADATRIFRQFVAEGANMVLSSADYGDFLMDVARLAPEVAFVQCDSNLISRNVSWYYVSQWYACYVIGVAAGLLTRTGQIGYIASFPLPSVYASANALLLGARSVRPDATVRVVSINSWFDPQGALGAATALADSGCDILSGIMDEPAYLRLAQARGLWAIMSNNDERAAGPDAYLSSIVYDFRPYYVEQVRARLEGRWTPTPAFLPLGAGTDRDAWGARVPENVRRQADAVRARILTGWSPFAGPIHDSHGNQRVAVGETMSDLTLYHWNWPVDGVLGLD
ncbi:BMP family ABC transporter substrate-binding protein [Acetobacter fallax]|uniref:BMP family ABC transporter substrate-binding protein n=1 Tax=Acetobacter fallax TaxID=1737473 RepID=A0ABX0KC95_9PROT|nr:BMP family ABC transporter substrate-binding protein [Acetobacter fallax]NHO31592.1 BMP family ABC transporter substrate-binding protein [Acetobacter fallax]NHO35151.1 BMP family ABC transporter substrate-binding protein [Acetobacter fallax]